MFLVLAHYGDELARSVYDRLSEKHGADNARLLTSDELALSTRWALRHEGQSMRTEMHFADGAQLLSDDITAVFNRLRFTTMPNFAEASEEDRDYAVMEMHAFLLSWLSGLKCAVVNRASPRSLGGDARSRAEWLLLAARAGLAAQAMRFATSARDFPKTDYDPLVPLDGAGLNAGATLKPAARAILGAAPVHFMAPVGRERRRVLVIGEDIRGDHLPDAVREGCLRLARLSDCACVEFTFARAATGSDWNFCDANLYPTRLDTEELEILIRMLESGKTGSAEGER